MCVQIGMCMFGFIWNVTNEGDSAGSKICRVSDDIGSPIESLSAVLYKLLYESPHNLPKSRTF